MNANISYSLYLYGSASRGDMQASSDVDVLVVCNSNKPIDKEDIQMPETLSRMGDCSDISFYSIKRLKEMYATGHLYAWHLFLESRFVGVGKDILRQLGKPMDYQNFNSDVEPLLELLQSISIEIKRNPKNLVYEAGLAYLCVRNIAMSVSYYSPINITFSAYAPYLLTFKDNPFPLQKRQYETLRQCRLSSTRGICPPEIKTEELNKNIIKLFDWCCYEVNRVNGESYEASLC